VVQAVDPDTQEVIAETPEDGSPLQISEDREVILRVDTGRKITGKQHG
jgi:hypothetical protein